MCPRGDTARKGEAAVQRRRISRAQLALLERNEGLHANAIEHLPLFVSSVVRIGTSASGSHSAADRTHPAHTLPQLLAVVGGLPASQINRFAAKYLAVRVAFAVAYLGITDLRASFIRTGLWWTGNVLCFRTLVAATRALNAASLRR